MADEKLKEGDTPLFDLSDKDLIRFAYKNQNRFIMDTVAPEMTRRLKVSTDSLNTSIKELDRSNKKSSNRMIILTVMLLILTMVLSWQTFMQFIR